MHIVHTHICRQACIHIKYKIKKIKAFNLRVFKERKVSKPHNFLIPFSNKSREKVTCVQVRRFKCLHTSCFSHPRSRIPSVSCEQCEPRRGFSLLPHQEPEQQCWRRPHLLNGVCICCVTWGRPLGFLEFVFCL